MLRLYKVIRPASGYHTDQPPTSSKNTAELFAKVRDNGRILDNTRCVLGGMYILEAEIPLDNIPQSYSALRGGDHLSLIGASNVL
jgi:hypothetical protein